MQVILTAKTSQTTLYNALGERDFQPEALDEFFTMGFVVYFRSIHYVVCAYSPPLLVADTINTVSGDLALEVVATDLNLQLVLLRFRTPYHDAAYKLTSHVAAWAPPAGLHSTDIPLPEATVDIREMYDPSSHCLLWRVPANPDLMSGAAVYSGSTFVGLLTGMFEHEGVIHVIPSVAVHKMVRDHACPPVHASITLSKDAVAIDGFDVAKLNGKPVTANGVMIQPGVAVPCDVYLKYQGATVSATLSNGMQKKIALARQPPNRQTCFAGPIKAPAAGFLRADLARSFCGQAPAPTSSMSTADSAYMMTY